MVNWKKWLIENYKRGMTARRFLNIFDVWSSWTRKTDILFNVKLLKLPDLSQQPTRPEKQHPKMSFMNANPVFSPTDFWIAFVAGLIFAHVIVPFLPLSWEPAKGIPRWN